MTNFNHWSKQKKIFWSLVALLSGVCAIPFFFSDKKEDKPDHDLHITSSRSSKLSIQSVKESIPEDKAWRYSASEKIEDQSKKQETDTQKILEQLEKMQGQVDALQNEPKVESAPILFEHLTEAEDDFSKSVEEALPVFVPKEIKHHRLSLKDSKRFKPKEERVFKTTDTIIPATTFVKATLLSGVDASTAIASSADPTPVLLRLRDDGDIARYLKSDLKDCRINASAKGNLSAERVEIRLEKLVCTEVMTKEVIETAVAGYVVGPDGKNGIRGEVVSKEGKYLGRAFTGGLLSGFASVLNPDNAYRNPGNAIIKNSQKQSKGDLFQSGLGGSVSSSTDRLAQYYIDRAEQIQPVISIPGGIDLDIVFTESVDIGSSNVKQVIANERHKQNEEQLKHLWQGEQKND